MKNTLESHAKELQYYEHHFTLDPAENMNMTMSIIFSIYQIRKSGIAERNVPHVCASMRTSDYWLIQWRWTENEESETTYDVIHSRDELV